MKKVFFTLFFLKVIFASNIEVSVEKLSIDYLDAYGSENSDIFNEKYGGKTLKITGKARKVKFGQGSTSKLYCYSTRKNKYVYQSWNYIGSAIDKNNCYCVDKNGNNKKEGSYEDCLFWSQFLETPKDLELEDVDDGLTYYIYLGGFQECYGKRTDLKFNKTNYFIDKGWEIKVECLCDSIIYNENEYTSDISTYNYDVDTLDFMDTTTMTKIKLTDCKFLTGLRPTDESIEWVMYDQGPMSKKAVLPKYPDICKQRRIKGTVVVNFWIDKDGIVDTSSIKIVESIPCFDQHVVDEIKKSTWHPAVRGGKRIGTALSMPFNFN